MPSLIKIGELIDHTWDHYRERFLEVISISGWLLILSLFNIISLMFYPTITQLGSVVAGVGSLGFAEGFGIILFAFTNLIVNPLLGVWILASLVCLFKQHKESKTAEIKTAIREGFSYFFPTLFVIVLFGLLLIGAILLGFVPGIILSALGNFAGIPVLTTLGVLAIIVGIIASFVIAIRWMVLYSLSIYAPLMDEKRGKDAFLLSRSLVQGRFWSVLLRLVLPKILFLGVGIVLISISVTIAEVFISTSAGLNLDISARLSTIVQNVFPNIVAVLINPLLIIADLVLYLNLKETLTTPTPRTKN